MLQYPTAIFFGTYCMYVNSFKLIVYADEKEFYSMLSMIPSEEDNTQETVNGATITIEYPRIAEVYNVQMDNIGKIPSHLPKTETELQLWIFVKDTLGMGSTFIW